MLRRVYLDNAATTPVAPEVVEAMMPYLTEQFGNPSSIHYFGQQARAAVDRARHQVAQLINARPNDITFTSGGTEANNLAIRGLMEANSRHGRHIVTTNIEHPSVGTLCDDLEKHGWEVTRVAVDADGLVSVDDVMSAVTPETVLVSVMLANNEIGTIQPLADIARRIKELREAGRKIWLHSDAVQAAGKISVDVEELGCDLLTMSAHKIYAPKGVGALYTRRGVRLHPQSIGGHQERERRGGTESVPLIAGFGRACEIAAADLESESARLSKLRDDLEDRIAEAIPDIIFNGHREHRLPNISNISFPGVEGEALLINLDMQGIAVSTGSACSSGTLEPSPVIRALSSSGTDRISDEDRARGAIRFSFGRSNSIDDVGNLLIVLPSAVENLRRLNGSPK